MPRHLVLSLVAVLLMACATAPAAPDEAPPAATTEVDTQWVEVNSPEGEFAIAFPGTPTETRSTQPTELGDLPTAMWLLELNDSAFMVMIVDYPEGFMAKRLPQDVLEGARDGAMKNIGGQIFEDRQVFADRPGGGKLPGRQVGAETPMGLYYRGQMFMKGDRLYQITYVAPKASKNDELFRIMTSSFKVLP